MTKSDDITERLSSSEEGSKTGTWADPESPEALSQEPVRHDKTPMAAPNGDDGTSKRASHLDFLDDDDEDESVLIPRPKPAEVKNAGIVADSSTTVGKGAAKKSASSSIHSLFDSSEELNDISFGSSSTAEIKSAPSVQDGASKVDAPFRPATSTSAAEKRQPLADEEDASRQPVDQVAEHPFAGTPHQGTNPTSSNGPSPSGLFFPGADSIEPPCGAGFISNDAIDSSTGMMSHINEERGNEWNTDGPAEDTPQLAAIEPRAASTGETRASTVPASPRSPDSLSDYKQPTPGSASPRPSSAYGLAPGMANAGRNLPGAHGVAAGAAQIAENTSVVGEYHAPDIGSVEPRTQMHQQRLTGRDGVAKFIQKMKEDRLRYKPLTVSLSSAVVVYVCSTQQRYISGVAVQKEINVFAVKRISVPEIKSIAIKDRAVNLLLDARLSERTPLAKVEAYMGIEPSEIVQHDLVIGRRLVNELFQAKGALSCEDFCKMVLRDNIRDEFALEMLKAKLGMALDPQRRGCVQISSSYLAAVAMLNNPTITRMFIEAQDNFMAYFIIFYKLGLVSIMEFAGDFYNNLYYLAVLRKISKGEDLSLLSMGQGAAVDRPSWSFKSVLDFGISKILSVESSSEKAVELDLYRNIAGGRKESHAGEDRHPGAAGTLHARSAPHAPQMDLPQRLSRMGIGDIGRPSPAANSQPAGSDASSSADRINMTPEKKSELKSIFEDSEDIDIFDGAKGSGSKGGEEAVGIGSGDDLPSDVANENYATAGTGARDGVESEAVAAGHGNAADGGLASCETASHSSIYGNDQGPVSSSDLSSGEKQPAYKKKFAKSFADIFSLGSGSDGRELDVSSYIDDVGENDKPMLVKEYEEESKPSIFNVFGMFRKKERPAAAKNAAPVAPRPPKAAIKIPEKPKGPSVIKDLYANKKSPAIEIPGAGAPTVKRHVLNPDRTTKQDANSPGSNSECNTE